MKRPIIISLGIAGCAALLVAAVHFSRSTDSSLSHSDSDWVPVRRDEVGLSHVYYAAYYMKAKRSIEVKFEGPVAFVDGEVFRGQNLESALRKKREEKKVDYLVLLAEDYDRYGPLVERASQFRKLGFDSVVLMTTR